MLTMMSGVVGCVVSQSGGVREFYEQQNEMIDFMQERYLMHDKDPSVVRQHIVTRGTSFILQPV
jgi:hypothetical protein